MGKFVYLLINFLSLYGMNNLEDSLFSFESTLNTDSATSLLDLIVSHKKRMENMSKNIPLSLKY